MALPVYPATITHKPQRDAFRVLEGTRPVLWTEFEDGPPLARRSGQGRRAKLAYRLDFKTAAEYEVFRAFHETTLADGTQRFTMPVYIPATNSYVNRTVMIDEGKVDAESLGMGFTVTFTLIVFNW